MFIHQRFQWWCTKIHQMINQNLADTCLQTICMKEWIKSLWMNYEERIKSHSTQKLLKMKLSERPPNPHTMLCVRACVCVHGSTSSSQNRTVTCTNWCINCNAELNQQTFLNDDLQAENAKVKGKYMTTGLAAHCCRMLLCHPTHQPRRAQCTEKDTWWPQL